MDKVTEMQQTIKKICALQKGILAADESTCTIGKRFSQIDVENNHDNRFEYRRLVFNTPKLSDHISGVITFEETLFDKDNDGNRLIQPLLDNGIVVGIKTDRGLINIPYNEEKMTKGLDDLAERSKRYYDAGARFAKWRCVFTCDPKNGLPTLNAIETNAYILAKYAAISQENGLVSIVEPEVLMDGDNTIEESESITRRVLSEVYYQLSKAGVRLDCTLLKPNMVRSGSKSESPASNENIARRTVQVLRDIIPPSVPGIVFLSGGMTDSDSTECLKLINQYKENSPWRLSFSYGRALQQITLHTWKGKSENIDAAQKLMFFRAHKNGLASNGQ